MNETDEVPVEAVDTEDMIRRERYRAIFDARRECRDIRRKTQNLVSTEKEATHIANSHYRHALETYIREVESLLSQTEEGRRYWSEYDFGKMTVSPAVESASPGDGRARKKLIRTGSYLKEAPPEKQIDLVGLKCLFETSSPLTFEADCYVHSHAFGEGLEVETVNVETQIDFHTLDEMYAVVNGYLSKIGLDVEIGKAEEGEWDTSYRQNGQYDPSA
jgi:hypothetical protein